MAANQYKTTENHYCPRCESRVVFAHGSWSCLNCTYAPKRGPD